MMTRGWRSLLLGMLLIAGIGLMTTGCGNGGGNLATSGTLTLDDIAVTDLSGGKYAVETAATFTPATGTNVAGGPEIEYTAKFGSTTRSGKVIPQGTTGRAVIGPWQVDQAFEPIVITIVATTGGLSATKISSIPAIASLSIAPAAIAFTNTDTVGTSKTVTVSGGFSPYTVSSAAPGDISATISGSTITIIKLAPSSLTQASTTVTVTDNKGNQAPVTVGYYK